MSNGHRAIYVGLVAVVGLLLVVLAAPRIVAGLLLVPHGGAPGAVARRLESVPDRDVQLAALGRTRALEWHATAPAARDLATLRLTQAVRATDEAAFEAAVTASLTAAERSLLLAPSQPTVWFDLAYARVLRDGVSGSVDAPLARSLATGAYDPRLMLPRIDLALATWRGLSPETQAQVAAQIAVAYGRWPQDVAVLAQRRRAAATVRQALAPYPALATRFVIDYGQAVRGN